MKKLLIANRGEIAIRIARAARDYGVPSVAVYSDADMDSLHVRYADEAYGLGPGGSADTYLNIVKLLDVAQRAGVDAVHPGYGFLSERPEFAEGVIQAGLIWVGPPPEVIKDLGDKIEARRIARAVGAPLVSGSDGPLASPAEAVSFAQKVGLPIAIKAAFGGGGRGMRVVHRIEEVAEAFESAVREATAAFGRGDCYAEQFLERPRHVEAQVVADTFGNTVVLGSRDCSLQRRNQKLVEEAPAPFLTEEQRGIIHGAALSICKEAGYIGAGTVEFLLSRSGLISFLEVNTRLQVEHTVTEETTGIDIVTEQLRIADGLPLSIQSTPEPRCHAFEFRINAEDPGRGFLPTPGVVTLFRPPSGPGIRLDGYIESGSRVSDLYDSMMAKLVVVGKDRSEALQRARRALDEFAIEGVSSVIPFHRAVLREAAFVTDGRFDVYTNWIETEFTGLEATARVEVGREHVLRGDIEINGRLHRIAISGALLATLGQSGHVHGTSAVDMPAPPDRGEDSVLAPVSGTLRQWMVSDGDVVRKDDAVAVIESMKMETMVRATTGGRVCLTVATGASVANGDVLARLEARGEGVVD